MKYYKLTVTCMEDNPNYDEEMKNYKEESRSNYGYSNKIVMTPVKYISIDNETLQVTLTEEEFAAVKKGVLEVM